MRVLVTWGSKRGGTEGIGRTLADALERNGAEVTAVPVQRAPRPAGFDAVIVGGALYANRWPAHVRRYVRKHVAQLRRVPVWFFSSGPLDESAEERTIPPPTEVAVLAERVGARGHMTFGGRLQPNAHGFPASAMAKTSAGDWRNPEQIRTWANELGAQLPHAMPGSATDHPARALSRLLTFGAVGWAFCAAIMGLLLQVTTFTAAAVVHAIAAPAIFAAVAHPYFRARGAREPLPTALTWTALVAGLDLLVLAGLLQGSLDLFLSIGGTWLPFLLIFLATWATGGIHATLPWPQPPEPRRKTSSAAPAHPTHATPASSRRAG